MDDLLKRRMYSVLVKTEKGKGLAGLVQLDVLVIATFRWTITYQYTEFGDEPFKERRGLARPASSSPEKRLEKVFRELVKRNASIICIEAYIRSESTSKDIMQVVFDTRTCRPIRFNQLVTEKSEVLSCPK